MCAKLFVHTRWLHTAEILRLNSCSGGATSGRSAGLLSTWPSWGTADLWDYCWRERFWTWWPGVHRVSSSISWYWRFGGCCNSAFAGGTFNQGRSPERAVTGITASFLIHCEFFKFVKSQSSNFEYLPKFVRDVLSPCLDQIRVSLTTLKTSPSHFLNRKRAQSSHTHCLFLVFLLLTLKIESLLLVFASS